MRLRFWQAAERRVLKRLPLLAACSDAARQQLIDHGISANRTRVVHNAASPPKEIAPIDHARLALPNDRPLALFIGRLIASKRCDLLLRAAAKAGWSVAIVGEGPERADLEALAQRLHVPAHFAGFQADPWPWHAAADAVVLPSEMEALPVTLIEAAACGRPAVATQVGGIPEVVRQEETGLLVPRGDEAGLADALELLKDLAMRERLGAAARADWQAHFAPEVMAEALKRLYFEACPR
jgi:glycosyltransferase involved in cell wall biosynthesis